MRATRNTPISFVLAAISVSLIGCANMRGDQVSSAPDSELLAEKDLGIDRLNVQIASLETALTEDQKMAAARHRQMEEKLLPPEAKPGQCFAQVYAPPEYETVAVRVLKSEASKRVEIIPVQFQTVEERVLVK